MSIEGDPRHSDNFLASLPPLLRASLLSNSRRAKFKDGQRIHSRGDRKPSLSIIESGTVRFSNLGRDGERITTATLLAGEAFGEFTLFTDMPRMHDADAAEDTIIAVIPQRRFETLLSTEPNLRKFIISFLAQRLLFSLELLEDERRLPLAMKLAKLLVRLTAHSTRLHTIATTQVELAEELGVSRVAMGTALKKLKSNGHVKVGYGQIEIVERELLERWIQSESQLLPLGGYD